MAAKVLKSFLIGIGYDTKGLEAGENKITGSLESIKSRSLSLSSSIVGAFSAGAASVAATARSVDRLSASTQNLRTSTNAVYNYGNAIRLMGGDASEALDAIKGFEEIQNNFRLNGEKGPLEDLARAGIDVETLYSTKTGEEFMRALSDMLPNLDEGQRSQVQGALGLSDYTMRAISSGSGKLDELIRKASSLTGPVDGLTENSRKLMESASELGLAVEGIRNELADKFLPSLIGASQAVNSFIKNYRPEISQGIDALANNPEATAGIAAGAAASTAGSILSKFGMGKIGGMLKGAGQLGMMVGISELAVPYIDPMFDKLFGVQRGPESVEAGSGQIIRSKESIDYLNRVYGETPAQPGEDQNARKDPVFLYEPEPSNNIRQENQDVIFGERSADDTIMPSSGATPYEERQATAEAIAGALTRSPVKVNNQLGVTLQLDGQALETKIIQVNERQNYEALGDLTTTTER